MNTSLIWVTPDADRLMGYIARVSNPANQDNPEVWKLLKYCADNAHWSVFEHAHACIEINTTRDIGRQILRHKSFSYSEFSGRYQSYDKLPQADLRECRLQDTKNRQNSLPTDDNDLAEWWEFAQKRLLAETSFLYNAALTKGIAKEQARALLPEGLTPSRLYMTGSMRSWITYLQVRDHEATQKEHQLIAKEIKQLLIEAAPQTMKAFFN